MPALLPIAGLLEFVTDVGAAAEINIIAGFSAVGLTSVGVGVAGAVGSGILALGGASGLGAAIGAWAVAGTVLELAFYKPKLNSNGSPQQFKADTNAPIPVVEGHFGVGGNIVYLTTSGGSNKAAAGAAGNEYLTACVVLSALGPIQGFESLKFNDTILNFSGQNCTGGYILADTIGAYNVPYHNNNNGTYENDQYNNHAWQNFQAGNVPTSYFAPPAKLASDNASLPEWDSTHGLSGFAASFLTIVYDQTVYAGGQPKPLWTLNGIAKYDPRQDSTYAGGSGTQRWAGQGASSATLLAARASYAYNTNPIISALNFALGYWLPDANGVAQLYAGAGVPPIGVDIAAFVAAANVADANGWTLNGQWTTNDDPYSVFTAMLQCGGASPTDKDGRVSCIINTPLTSLGTITNNDLTGPIAVDTQAAIKNRINRVWPRFRSEPHNFDMVPVTVPIFGASYVAEDQNRYRDKQLDYEFVTAVNQCCQLAAYDIANSREGIVAVIPGKQTLANYRVGDAVTVTIDEANLTNQKMLVIKRSPDFNTGGVTLTLRSETDAKHPFALGQSGVAPASPTISGVDPSYVGAPLPDYWATGALTLLDPNTGESTSVIQITGAATDNVYAQVLLVRYRLVADVNGTWMPLGAGAWTYTSFASSQGQFNVDLNPGAYDVQIAYQLAGGAGPTSDADWLDLGVETVGGSISASTASVPAHAPFGGSGQTAASIVAALLATSELASQVPSLASAVGAIPPNLSQTLASLNATALTVPSLAEAVAGLPPNLSQTITTLMDTANEVPGLSSGLSTSATVLAQQVLAFGALQGYVQAQTQLNGVQLGTVVENISQNYTTGQQAIVDTLNLIGATSDGNTAFILSGSTLQVSPGLTLATQLQQMTTSASTATALVQTNLTDEQTARIDGDTALQTQLTLLGATAPGGTAFVLNTETVQVGPGLSLAQQFTNLQSATGAVSSNLSNNYFTTTQTSGAISSAISAAEVILNASIGAVSSNLSNNYFTTTQTSGAISSAISAAEVILNASIGAVSSNLSNNYFTTTQTNGAISSAISAAEVILNASIGAVSSNLSNNYFTTTQTNGAISSAISAAEVILNASIGAVSSNLSNNYFTTTQTNGAISSAISAAEVILNASIGAVSSNLSNDYFTTTQTNGAISSAISAAEVILNASIGAVSSNLSNNYFTSAQTNGAISTAVAESLSVLGATGPGGGNFIINTSTVEFGSAGQSLSQYVLNVQGEIGGDSVSISELFAVTNAQEARVAFAINTNGQITGLDFGSNTDANSGYMDFVASVFRFVDPASGNAIIPLSYVAGAWTFNSNVTINGTLLVNGSVGTGAIAAGAITNTTYSETTATTGLGAVNATPVQIGSLTLTDFSGTPLTVDVVCTFVNTDGGHDQNISIVLYRDGTQVGEPFYCFARQNSAGFSGGAPITIPAAFFDTGATAGNHTWTVKAQVTGGTSNQVSATLCRIIIQDLRTEA